MTWRPSPNALAVFLLAATAVAVRETLGYRAFPSIDDFAYLPLAWASHDPTLFPRDTLLQAFVHHTPVWDVVVALLDRTVGEAAGFWALTVALTVATLAAVARLLRATGASLGLLPIVAAVAFCGPVIGFGRGAYDGALGDAFHAQWLALAALLWSYDAFVRRRPIAAGIWLGAAALGHPAVAAQGAFAVVVATLAAGHARWKELLPIGLAALVISLPVAIPVAASLFAAGPVPTGAWPAETVIKLGYVFRASHHYLISSTAGSTWWYLLSAVLAGLGAAAVRRPEGSVDGGVRALAGLLAGQAALAGSAVLWYGDWLPDRWRYASTLPYVLDLSRTSGLLLPLAAVLVAGALERRAQRRGTEPLARELLWAGLLAVSVTALLWFVTWRPLLACVVVLGLVAHVGARRPGAARAAVVGLALAVAGGTAQIWRTTELTAPLSGDEAALYRWVQATPRSALFVVPPGMEGFRFYGRRSAYVDFKLFDAATPAAVPEWRRRMELVSAPDKVALAATSWSAVAQWDRTYASRNTPARIEGLLRTTGADYLVWDRQGLEVPPFAEVRRDAVPGVSAAYENPRFAVYRLSSGTDAGR